MSSNLDYTIKNLDEVTSTERLDAEYFSKKFDIIARKLSKYKLKTLRELGIKVVSGPFGSTLKSHSYQETGIPFIRISDMDDFFLNKDNLVYISEADHTRLSSSQLDLGDLVLSKVGNSIGIVSKITKDIGRSNISENNIGIKLGEDFNSDYEDFVLAYLLSSIGQAYINRAESGNAQPKLNVSDVENIPIPLTAKNISKHVGRLIETAYKLRGHSKKQLDEAEQILNSIIGLDGLDIDENTNTKNYHELSDDLRFDSEYYLKKYDDFETLINRYEVKELGELAKFRKGVEPGSSKYIEKGTPFIRVSDISEDGIEITSTTKYISQTNAVEYAERAKPNNTDILFTKDGTIGTAYLFNDDKDVIVSGAFLILDTLDNVHPEYLSFILNSKILKIQIERLSGGAVINHLKPSEAKKLLIPMLSRKETHEIIKRLQDYRTSQLQYQKLLGIAKKSVEIFVEIGEEEAISFINKNEKSNT